MKKIFIGFAVVALLMGVSITSAQAQSTAELEALIAQLTALTAQISALGGNVPTSGGYTFSTNLSKGSRGADVTALQEILISGGYLNIAAPTGYFGDLTKAAVMKWQTAEGLTSDGRVGPVSRGVLNSMGSTMPGPITGPGPTGPCVGGAFPSPLTGMCPGGVSNLPTGCQEGDAFSRTVIGLSCTAPTPTTLPTGCMPGEAFSRTVVGLSCTTAPAPLPAGCMSATQIASYTTGMSCAVTTPPPVTGTEGTITASKAATPASGTKAYEGGTKVGVLGIKLEAKISDIKVERVKLQLSAVTSGNSDQQFYTKIANNIYVMDGSTVLASMALDANTVVKEGSLYYITISGFSFIVPKNAIKVLTIAIDPKASWDSTFDNDSWKLTVPVDGVRGVDGVGIDQKSPTTAFNNEFTSAADVVDSAALTVSLASDSPVTGQVIANEGSSDNEFDNLVLAKFDFKGEKDRIKVTDLTVDLVRGGGNNVATATTAYIYEGGTISGGKLSGGTLIGSATVAGTSATAANAAFTNIDWIIPADTTKSLYLTVDIDSAALAADTYAVDIGPTTAVATRVVSENSAGSSITETGSAQGRTMTIRKVGPVISLVSKLPTSTSGVAQSDTSTNLSTSTLSATFNVKIKAVGGTLTLGNVASGTPLFASSTASFKVYRNGAYDGSISSGATSTSYSIPSLCVAEAAAKNGCTLTDGNEVTIPVTFQISGRTVAGVSLTRGSVYAIGLEGITWFNATTGSSQTTTFMAGETDWRTSDASFP